MESTAQYWRPVWEALEQHWRPRRRARDGAPRLAGTLHLAQAQSNRGTGGRKKDFPDAERLVKRLVAPELSLSFVPDVEQRRCEPRAGRPLEDVHGRARILQGG
jgi:acetoacetate decarboxylase